MAEEINARIQHVGKTESQWLADTTVLLEGEIGCATNTQVIKVGNGQDVWRDLKSHQGEQGDSIEYVKIDDNDLIVKIEGQSEENLGNVRGPQGEQGDSIEYTKIVDDDLIVKIEGQPEVNLGDVRGPQGEQGHSVEYAKIVDNELIIKIENEPEVNLGKVKGDKGEPFTYDDLTDEQRLEIRGAEIDTSGFVSLTELNEAIENVDVSDQLAGKADVDHTHSEYVTADEVADLVPDVDLSNYYTKAEHDDSIEALAELYSPIDHTHNIADVANLQSSLNDKANVNHTHSISDISNLQSQLNLKASSTHLHDERYSKIGHTHSEYALKSEVPKINQVTQSEYDRLWSKDDNTLYVVVG